MIVDTSAILALAFGEAKVGDIFDRLTSREPKRISSVNLFEIFAVVDRRNDREATRLVEESIERFSLMIEPVTLEHVLIARGAWNRFGNGSGHPAGLDFGDCFAYALASIREEPLLFVGHDFVHTDIEAALSELQIISVPVSPEAQISSTRRAGDPTKQIDALMRACFESARGIGERQQQTVPGWVDHHRVVALLFERAPGDRHPRDRVGEVFRRAEDEGPVP